MATLKGDLDVMGQYRKVSHGTDFLFNTSHYQPYGEYYFLYSEEKRTIMRMIKADSLAEKRIIITLPVHFEFFLSRMPDRPLTLHGKGHESDAHSMASIGS